MSLTTHALTTVANVKSELNLSGSTDDTYIENLVNTFSEAIEQYCSRHFERNTSVSETHAGYQSMNLVVDQAPIGSITSIAFNGSTLDSSSYEIQDANAGIIRLLGGAVWTAAAGPGIMASPYPGSERPLYTVVYSGGYICPNQSGTRSLPYNIEQACILACASAYRARGRDRTIQSETVLSASQTYAAGSGNGFSALPQDVCDLLAPYKRAVFA